MAAQKIDISNANTEFVTVPCPLTFPAPTTSDKGYITLSAPWTFNIISITTKTDSGTATAVVKVNGSAATGFSSVSVTSTRATVTPTAVAVAAGDIVTIEFSAVSSPVNLCAQLNILRT